MAWQAVRVAVVGVLHPGVMGSFLGRAVRAAGHEVLWVGAGRSTATRERAAGFTEVGELAELTSRADTVLSVCPPLYAVPVAEAVARAGLTTGRYVDANAVSPATVQRVADVLPGVDVVDGAVIGGPSTADAVLHLCGPGAAQAATLFDAATLTVRVLDRPFGAASALKACYALVSKAMGAALLTARAAAEAAGVGAELVAEWNRSDAELVSRSEATARRLPAKAWRFGPEMTEAALFFREVGVPDGFSTAAAEVSERLAGLKARADVEPAEVWRLLAGG